MMDILLMLALLVFLFLNVKIEFWATISNLGFQSETPLIFMNNPKKYISFQYIFLFILIAMSFESEMIPWYILMLLCLAIVWLGNFIGKKLAFNKYRAIIKEMALYSNDIEEKNKLLEELKKSTNKELQEQLNFKKNFGI
jgi:hypothetical protein